MVHVDLWVWGAFVVFLVAMVSVDLFLHREPHTSSVREAAVWSAIWIGLGLTFGGLVWMWMGPQAGGQYLAGYLLEKSLSADNVFVFALIFGAFAVPDGYRHGVLLWGVLGALVFRAIFIATGITLLERFHWTLYVFGAFLLIAGFRMAISRDRRVTPARNRTLRALRRVIPMTEGYDGQRMVVRRAGRVMITPLLAVLVVVETTDIVFAADSIPAILAVTTSPFLVFTSNAFAILGLRALYSLLAGLMERLRYLKFGLAAILVFVGVKMLAVDVIHVPIWLSLVAIATVLGVTITTSMARRGSMRTQR